MEITTALITIATLDLARMEAFYTGLLGMNPSVFQPQCYAEYQLVSLRIGLFQPLASDWPEFSQTQHSPLSLCLHVENLQLAVLHLRSLNATFASGIHTASHGRELYAYDPEGNRLILYQPGIVTLTNDSAPTGNP